jgi:two-component system sensor histidine kinase DesK
LNCSDINPERPPAIGSNASDAERSLPAQSLIGSLRQADKARRGGSASNLHKHGHHRLFDLIWLVYSAFFFVEPVERNNRAYWIQFAAAYLIFLALYAGVILARSRRMSLLMLAGLAVLGLVYYPHNAGASGIFIYVVAFIPFITDSLVASISVFVSVSFAMMAEGLLLHLSPWSWGFSIFMALAVGSGNLIAAQRMRANQKLNLAHEEISHLAKVAERERIARDLHDVLGHTLSVVVLKSELAGKLLESNPDRSRKEMAEVEQIARSALGEVRQAIRGYRSEGLAAELDRARTTLDAAGVTLECTPNPPKLRPAEETVLSLIVREAVTNIVRHAQASHCQMNIQESGGATSLVVEDDGRGGIRQEGNGLRGMRERVESLGGHFRIDSGHGTRLVIEIPGQELRG